MTPIERCDRCEHTLEKIWDYPLVTLNDVTIHDITRESLVGLYGEPASESSPLLTEDLANEIVEAANNDEIQIFLAQLLNSKGETKKIKDILPTVLEEHDYGDFSYTIPGTDFFINFAQGYGMEKKKAVISLMRIEVQPDFVQWATLATIDYTGQLNRQPVQWLDTSAVVADMSGPDCS